MIATGLLFMAKMQPLVTTAKDGTFCVTLLAYDRLGVHQVECWCISYYGEKAKAFWEANVAALNTPGQPVLLEVKALRTLGSGRYGRSEIYAEVVNISLAPHLNHKPLQSTPDVRDQLPNSEQALGVKTD